MFTAIIITKINGSVEHFCSLSLRWVCYFCEYPLISYHIWCISNLMLNTVDVLAIVLNPFLVISEGSSALIFFFLQIYTVCQSSRKRRRITFIAHVSTTSYTFSEIQSRTWCCCRLSLLFVHKCFVLPQGWRCSEQFNTLTAWTEKNHNIFLQCFGGLFRSIDEF